MPLIDLKAQYDVLRARIDANIARVLDHQQFILGPEVDELIEGLAARTGARHVIPVASGSDALKIPLMAAGIGEGDAVFVPSFTFVATAEVAAELGATPVFVDIDPSTFTIDPDDLEDRVERTRRDTSLRPRAVIPVDLFGHPADYADLNDRAARHGLMVVADAAQSFGASSNGRPVGALAEVTATSFYPSKALGGYGDGGCIFTDDSSRAEAMSSIARHGLDPSGAAVNIGLNSRLDTLQAAVLLAKLGVFDDELKARQRIADFYDAELRAVVDVPPPFEAGTHAHSVYSIMSDHRDRVREVLSGDGISTAVYYATPLHLQPAYARYGEGPGSLPNTERASQRSLSLPMHPYLDEDTVRRICQSVTRALT